MSLYPLWPLVVVVVFAAIFGVLWALDAIATKGWRWLLKRSK